MRVRNWGSRGRRLVWYEFLGAFQENMVTELKFPEACWITFPWHGQETPNCVQQARATSYASFLKHTLFFVLSMNLEFLSMVFQALDNMCPSKIPCFIWCGLHYLWLVPVPGTRGSLSCFCSSVCSDPSARSALPCPLSSCRKDSSLKVKYLGKLSLTPFITDPNLSFFLYGFFKLVKYT